MYYRMIVLVTIVYVASYGPTRVMGRSLSQGPRHVPPESCVFRVAVPLSRFVEVVCKRVVERVEFGGGRESGMVGNQLGEGMGWPMA
jgi:hypothetical protein